MKTSIAYSCFVSLSLTLVAFDATAQLRDREVLIPNVTEEQAKHIPFETLDALARGETVYLNPLNRVLVANAVLAVNNGCPYSEIQPYIGGLMPLEGARQFDTMAAALGIGSTYSTMYAVQTVAGSDWAHSNLTCSKPAERFLGAVVESIRLHGVEAFEPETDVPLWEQPRAARESSPPSVGQTQSSQRKEPNPITEKAIKDVTGGLLGK